VPRANAIDADPDAFCSIDFIRPDLPWMFAPYGPREGPDTLTPWLCLIVVTARPLRAATLLPILSVDSGDELPPVAQAHAWAHTQISGIDGEDPASVLVTDPARTISRLVAARRLADRTSYLACVVPLYEGGRLAGLGQIREGEQTPPLAPAWPGESFPLDLPVYYSWQFTTTARGGFEELVRSLLPPKLALPGVGVWTLDASSPGGGIPDLPTGAPVLALELGARSARPG
jgi:hypothetical protein